MTPTLYNKAKNNGNYFLTWDILKRIETCLLIFYYTIRFLCWCFVVFCICVGVELLIIPAICDKNSLIRLCRMHDVLCSFHMIFFHSFCYGDGMKVTNAKENIMKDPTPPEFSMGLFVIDLGVLLCTVCIYFEQSVIQKLFSDIQMMGLFICDAVWISEQNNKTLFQLSMKSSTGTQ
jgi:hypothetical protein